MTDTAVGSGYAQVRKVDVTSDAARALVRRRYRAETRFRLYGLAAILFAAVFLVVLLADIVSRALPAFTQSRLSLDLPVSAEAVDPARSAAGDFDKVVSEGLLALFPRVTERRDRKALEGILSSGAADSLRRTVMNNPALIGQTVTAPVLLGSDADLYLKGISTKRQVISGEGSAAPLGISGTVEIVSNADVFREELARVEVLMAETVQALRREGDRLALVALSAEADLAAASNRLEAAKAAGDVARATVLETERAKFAADKSGMDERVAGIRKKAEELQQRIAARGSTRDLDDKMPSVLVLINDGVVKATRLSANRIEGEALVPLASTAAAPPGEWRKLVLATPEDSRKIRDNQIAFLEKLEEKGVVEIVPNTAFLASGDSREPELAGILGALAGSAYTMLVTLLLCLPIGVAAAIFLEEFAPRNRLTNIIEVNINNLAAVPSIVFGLLGLAMFLNFFGLPRSAPLVVGLVLALLVLPTIIIASRAALKAVPPSIREGALGVGASKQQAIFHHVLPLAMPGVLTGTIIGMAHALGETAPLLLIGMVAFIVDVPGNVTQASTVLPVQIFLWSDLPEVGFQAKTAAAIIVLLMFLFVMNGLAIWLRRKFERRW